MSLRSLIVSRGASYGDAARACGVDMALFDRIDAGLQPLPRIVAVRLAGLLGVSVADAIVEAPRFTNDASPAALRPVPPRLGLDAADRASPARLDPSLILIPSPPEGVS